MNVSCAKRNETRLEQQILTPNKFGRLKLPAATTIRQIMLIL